MADFQLVIKERQRMCKSFTSCDICPLGMEQKPCEGCRTWMIDHPGMTEHLVMQWSAEHPLMTNGEKFAEVFGKDLLKSLPDATWGDIVKWIDEKYKGDQNG